MMRTFAPSSRSDQKRHRYDPKGPIKPEPPPFDVHAERAAAYVELRRLFPEARAIGYIPPESAWRIAAFSLTGQLDPYLAAIGSDRRGLRRVSRLFDPLGADPGQGGDLRRLALFARGQRPRPGWPDGEPERSRC